MPTIAELLQKASEALPPQRPARSKWAQFVPVVRALESKGHSVLSAVDWIISEGGIATENRDTAYRSIRQLLERQKPKS